MSGIPNTWTWTTINKVSVKVTDGTHHSPKNFATGEYKYLTAKNVRVGRLELDDITYIPKQVHDEIYSRCDVQLNDVLLVKDGVNTGMSAVNTLDEPFSLLSSVGVIRPATCLSPHYLAHWFNGPTARQVMADQVAGVAITRMTLEKINAFPVPIAPRREQERIVAALDERLSELDASVASLERAERNLVRYRAAVLAAACSGKLVPTEADLARRAGRSYEPADQLLARILAERRKANTKAKYEEPAQPDTSKLPKLPEGWVWATVAQLGNAVTGKTPPTSEPRFYEGGSIPFFKPTDLNAGFNVRSADSLITPLGADETTVIPVGSPMVTCIGATIGKTGYARVAGATNQQINSVVNERQPAVMQWLYWFFISPGGYKAILERAAATTLPILNKGNFEKILVPLPPVTEQVRILEEVDRHLSRADALAASIAQSKRRAQRLRRAILAAAFQGRLVPQDPNDEPASVLLDRIRTQAATAEAATASAPRRGRPPAPPAAPVASASPPAMTPKRRGRPPGSKNKAKA